MAEFQIDRSAGLFLYTTGYNTSATFFFDDEDNVTISYASYWSVEYTEQDGPVSRTFGGSDNHPATQVGPINLGLDPTPAVRTFELKFESFPDSSDAISTGLEYYTVQSGAYLTSSVILTGKESGDSPYFNFADVLIGGSSHDRLSGLSGDDFLDGGAGVDYLEGDDGNDVISGGDNADTIHGNAGNDILQGDLGADSLYGGTGDDLYLVDSTDSVVELAGEGNDTVNAYGNAFTLSANIENLVRIGDASFRGTGNDGDNHITGGGGIDLLDGGIGNDTLIGAAGNDVLSGGLGADVLDGGAGIDTASYESAISGVNINLATGIGLGGSAAGDTLTGIENIRGGAGGDLLRGDAGVNIIYGNAGNDDLRGAEGNDRLFGGAGNDKLLGGSGNDQMTGGDGDDMFYINADGGRDTVLDFVAGAASGDTVWISSRLPFDSFEDILAVASQSGANTVIHFSAANSLTLVNVNLDSLQAADFIFA